jgi:hypothetical protein
MSTEFGGLDTPSWVLVILDQFEKAKFFDESDVAGQIYAAARKIESPSADEKKATDAECLAKDDAKTHGQLGAGARL